MLKNIAVFVRIYLVLLKFFYIDRQFLAFSIVYYYKRLFTENKQGVF